MLPQSKSQNPFIVSFSVPKQLEHWSLLLHAVHLENPFFVSWDDEIPSCVSGRKKIQSPPTSLVGGWKNPLKDMKVNWDDDIPNIWKKNDKNGPNHQAVFVYWGFV